MSDAELKAALVKYTCQPPADYKPLCPFPYINKGWDSVVKSKGSLTADYSSLVLDDCSMTWASSLSGQYTQYTLLYLIPMLCFTAVSIRWLYLIRENRLSKSGHKKGFTTTGEIIQYLNLASLVVSIIFVSSDIDSTVGRIPYVVQCVLIGISASCLESVAYVVVTSWVTIVTSGKTMQVPLHMSVLQALSIGTSFVLEIGGAVAENMIEKEYKAGYSGNANAVKAVTESVIFLAWGIVCLIYGRKIAGTLSSGGGGHMSKNAANLIRRYMFTTLFGLVLAVSYKVLFSIQRIGTTVYETPYCQPKWLNVILCLFLVLNFLILYTQIPPARKPVGDRSKPTSDTEKRQWWEENPIAVVSRVRSATVATVKSAKKRLSSQNSRDWGTGSEAPTTTTQDGGGERGRGVTWATDKNGDEGRIRGMTTNPMVGPKTVFKSGSKKDLGVGAGDASLQDVQL